MKWIQALGKQVLCHEREKLGGPCAVCRDDTFCCFCTACFRNNCGLELEWSWDDVGDGRGEARSTFPFCLPHGSDLPPRASMSCSSEGCGWFLSRAYMDITIPGVQNPHWVPWLLAILSWRGTVVVTAPCSWCHQLSPGSTARVLLGKCASPLFISVHPFLRHPKGIDSEAPSYHFN